MMNGSDKRNLKTFISKVINANGPAQIVSYSFWGVLVAGMYWDFCDDCVPNELLLAWGALSAAVLVASIWGTREHQKYLLISDMVLSAVIMCMILLHEPHTATITYTVDASGTILNKVVADSLVSEWFHVLALMWMTFHSLYLANLTQRQILERARFKL
jgi:preprotein translocase subunit SecG